jgi:epoxyqueuosine reductase
MISRKIFEGLRKHFGKAGFNLTVKIRSEDYEADAGRKAPGDFVGGAKSIILAGFAGRTFWDVFKLFLVDNPEFEREREDLIDDYTRLIFSELVSNTDTFNGSGHRIIFPFGKDALELDFVKLGILGGIGVPSLLGILLNPFYGTWVSLRGAIITDVEFDEYDSPLVGFRPCPSCAKPCITACPAHTVSETGWDWESCMRFRLDADTCSGKCASRLACPYGKEHAYGSEQIAYHHEFVLKSVREYFKKGDKQS